MAHQREKALDLHDRLQLTHNPLRCALAACDAHPEGLGELSEFDSGTIGASDHISESSSGRGSVNGSAGPVRLSPSCSTALAPQRQPIALPSHNRSSETHGSKLNGCFETCCHATARNHRLVPAPSEPRTISQIDLPHAWKWATGTSSAVQHPWHAACPPAGPLQCSCLRPDPQAGVRSARSRCARYPADPKQCNRGTSTSDQDNLTL